VKEAIWEAREVNFAEVPSVGFLHCTRVLTRVACRKSVTSNRIYISNFISKSKSLTAGLRYYKRVTRHIR
jgi:hypothetical protein